MPLNIYFFGWPGTVGGASTKLTHLLLLLKSQFRVTVVPTDKACLKSLLWQRWMKSHGIQWKELEDLPERLEGWGVALCNGEFLKDGMAGEARRRGLRLAWSSEMMWASPLECGALIAGVFDAVLFVSEAQRRVLQPIYARALGAQSEFVPSKELEESLEGWIQTGSNRRLRWIQVGNYIEPEVFPFMDRFQGASSSRPLTVGRLSRPDPDKFPDDFPEFYESLPLSDPRFRVMGWSEQLAKKWKAHDFDKRWDLLSPMQEDPVTFLHSLDLLVYSLSPRLSESWGRVVVEAMLTGVVPLIESDPRHHLRELVPHGTAGFHCDGNADFRKYARRLEQDPDLRRSMSFEARRFAVERLCNREDHLNHWRRLFAGLA